MKVIIDRFEGDYAVVEYEDGKLKNIERRRIPGESAEGDVLIIGSVITIDYDETKKRKEKLEKLSEGMWK